MQKVYYYKSVIGTLEIITENNSLIFLKLTDKIGHNFEKTETIQNVIQQLDEYFSGKRKVFDIKIKPKGTQFQQKVWNELLKIPYGETKSYSEIAENIGNKNSSRAVGNACNKNPIMLIIPCHRVISKSGKLSGFACGIDVKEKLLRIESILE